MSVHVMSWVLRHSDETLGRRLVLLVIADHASEDGTQSWCSVSTLAREARLSRRATQDALRRLEASGAIVETGKGPRGTHEYRVAMGGADSALGGADHDVGGAQITTSGGAVTTPEPSLEQPPEETSTAGAIERVYDHWRSARGKTRATYDRMSPTRRQKIATRLREFSEADLIAAIDAVAADPWHERHLHDDLTVIFRSHEQVERFLEMRQRSGSPLERALAWVRNTGWQYDDAALLAEMADQYPSLTTDDRKAVAQEALRVQQQRREAA